MLEGPWLLFNEVGRKMGNSVNIMWLKGQIYNKKNLKDQNT